MPTGFNYNDYNYSEIDYEIERQKKQVSALSRSTEILEIDDYENSDSENESTQVKSSTTSHSVQSNNKTRPPLNKAKSFQIENKRKELKRTNTETSIDLPSSDTDSEEDSIEELNGKDDDDDWAGEVVVRI